MLCILTFLDIDGFVLGERKTLNKIILQLFKFVTMGNFQEGTRTMEFKGNPWGFVCLFKYVDMKFGNQIKE